MKDYPVISVTCIVKNRVKVIKRAIDSVLNQDYPNVEIFVQDGMSTDGTLEILKSYGDRINLFSEEDDGPEDAINRAFAKITGDFYVNINSDEYFVSNTLFSDVIKEFKNNKQLGAVYGNLYITDMDGNYHHTSKNRPFTASDVYLNSVDIIFSSFIWDLKKMRKLGYNYLNETLEFELSFLMSAFYPMKYIDKPFVAFAVGIDTSSAIGGVGKKFLESYKRVENYHSLPYELKALFKYRDDIVNYKLYNIKITGYKFYEAIDYLVKVVKSDYFNILDMNQFVTMYQSLISLSVCANSVEEGFNILDYLKKYNIIFQGYYWAKAIVYNKISDFDKVEHYCKKEIENNPNYERPYRLLKHLEIRRKLKKNIVISIVKNKEDLRDNIEIIFISYSLLKKESDFQVILQDKKIDKLYVQKLVLDSMDELVKNNYLNILSKYSKEYEFVQSLSRIMAN